MLTIDICASCNSPMLIIDYCYINKELINDKHRLDR